MFTRIFKRLASHCWLLLFFAPVQVFSLPPFQNGWSEIVLSGSFPQTEPEEVKWRLHSRETPGEFDILREKYRLFVPPGYTHSQPWGVLVWVDSGNTPSIPAPWEKVLANQKLLLIAGIQSGNPRNIFDRMRMALHASMGIRYRFNIDSTRAYVAGFSGGGRVAGMLGIAWPDFFNGAISMMGVNFYTEIPSSKGTLYSPSFIPDDEALRIAREDCRHVLVTGEKDFNRGDIVSTYENGYRKQNFRSVSLLEVPRLGHALPDAATLEKALHYLDGNRERH
jgi:hypothetical protein